MSFIQMSISGGAMILAVVLIRAISIHRLPKITFLALWSVVLLRLLVPFTIPSAYNIYALISSVAPQSQSVAPFLAVSVPEASVPVNGQSAAAATAANPWLNAIWLAGAVCCALFFTWTYVRCRKEFQTSLPVKDEFIRQWIEEHRSPRPIQVRQLDRIATPLTYGVWRPTILLPKNVDWEDRNVLDYVLTHEYVHILRFDTAIKLVLIAALCLHWFNPLVWLMYLLVNRDIELACDETVVRVFGESTRSAYALALIQMEATKSGLNPVECNFSTRAIEERIHAVVKYPKMSPASVLLALILVFGSATAFITTPILEQVPLLASFGSAANNLQKYTPEPVATAQPVAAPPDDTLLSHAETSAPSAPAESYLIVQDNQANAIQLVPSEGTSEELTVQEKVTYWQGTGSAGETIWHVNIEKKP
ncbi:MAG TPA: M56 family metallopeptidase [Anaerolineaceae bacterium]|nr:M56 family metallopeptidase [Anaerolineaceae bacterium]